MRKLRRNRQQHTLFLHIGTPKTGTTSIQKFLIDNNAFIKKLGYDYPSLDFIDNLTIKEKLKQKVKRILKIHTKTIALDFDTFKNGKSLKYSFAGRYSSKQVEKLWGKIYKALEKNNVIISDEGFWSNPKIDIISAITEVKRKINNVKVIIYLRRQDLYLESNWNHHIKVGASSMMLEDFCDKYSFEVDYRKIIDEIAKVIGKENVVVRVFEKEQFYGGDIISDFLYACGIETPLENAGYPGRLNERLDGNVLFIKRLFNENYIPQNVQMNYRVINAFVDINQNISGVGYLSKGKREEIISFYSEDNEQIARCYLGRDDGKLFYNENTDIPQFIPDFNENEEEIISLFANLIGRI